MKNDGTKNTGQQHEDAVLKLSAQAFADELLQGLEEKIKRGEPLTKADLVPLSLTSLMGGESSLKDRIVRSYQIMQASKGVATEDVRKIEAVIYAMADKFLEEMDIEEIQEMMAMTKIGQVLVNRGKIEGKIEGMTDKLADQIGKKLKKGKTVTEIADALEETEEVISRIIVEYKLSIE